MEDKKLTDVPINSGIPPNYQSFGDGDHSIVSDRRSVISRTDLFPKTQTFSTVAIIIKSYIGLGVLATPYGMRVTGFLLAQAVLMVFSLMNLYTVALTI